MGLFASPALLQEVLWVALVPVPGFIWVHVDDILIAAPMKAAVHEILKKAFRRLDAFGFYISVVKSQLMPVQSLVFCGIDINTRSMEYSLSVAARKRLDCLLAGDSVLDRRGAGVIAYALFTARLSSAFRAWWWRWRLHPALRALLCQWAAVSATRTSVGIGCDTD